MSEIFENFEAKAKFQDESEAELIRDKLETLINNILADVGKRDPRFQNTLVKSGSVYEETKVCQPNEFDFMVKITPLTDKPLILQSSCAKNDGYVQLFLEEDHWKDFRDRKGCLSPYLLSRHFKKLIMESIDKVETPEGLSIYRAPQDESEGRLWLLFRGILCDSGKENSSGVTYSETHGPSTTLDIHWKGGTTYNNLKVNVDLTPAVDFPISKLPVQLLTDLRLEVQQKVQGILQKTGFHVVPAGFDEWRISFSVAEKEILATSPDGFKACYKVLKVLRDDVSMKLGLRDSLVPSYMFKTVLLSQLFTKDGHAWEKEFRSQTIIDVLELILQGIKQENLRNFFMPSSLLLSKAHDNELRRCLLEDMLNEVKGSKLAHSLMDVEEKKQQVKILQLIELLEYIFSCLKGGKNPTDVWKMMFANIGSVAGYRTSSEKFDVSWIDIIDVTVTELRPAAYRNLKKISYILEVFVPLFLATLQGEEKQLAQKYHFFLLEKKKKFEAEQPHLSKEEVRQIGICEFVSDWIFVHIVEKYLEEDNTTLSNTHKILPPEFCLPEDSPFRAIADITMEKGSKEGLALFEKVLNNYLSGIQEIVIMMAAVYFIKDMFLHAKVALKLKLDHITIPEQKPITCPELDLD